MTPFVEAINALKAEIRTSVEASLKRFTEKTGVTPTSIDIEFLDTRTYQATIEPPTVLTTVTIGFGKY
jgi:hypothetical protein